MKNLACLLALLLAGCNTSPTPRGQATPVHPNKIVAGGLLAPSGERTIPVVFTRDQGLSGGGGSVSLKIDGRPVAKFAVAETLTVYLAAGNHIFGAVALEALNPVGESGEMIVKGEPNRFRISILPGYFTVNFKVSRTAY